MKKKALPWIVVGLCLVGLALGAHFLYPIITASWGEESVGDSVEESRAESSEESQESKEESKKENSKKDESSQEQISESESSENESFEEESATDSKEESVAEKHEVSYTVKDKKVNAYDFIIATMTAPQYWSNEEYFPPYSAPWLEEEAHEAMPNATGWKLVDAETATFQRGNQGILTICFSTRMATIDMHNSSDTIVDYYDYTNRTLHTISDDGIWDFTYELWPHDEVSMYSMQWIIEETFLYYEGIFEKAGCPLYGQPAGTLTSYKNLEVNEVTYEGDGLIHYIWKMPGFSFNWEEDTSLTWLSDYRDIVNKKAPTGTLRAHGSLTPYVEGMEIPEGCELTSFNGTPVILKEDLIYYYSDVYLVLLDKDYASTRYEGVGGLWFEGTGLLMNITGAMGAYYLKPVIENLYGYNAVYFYYVDYDPSRAEPGMETPKDEFMKGPITISTQSGEIIGICNAKAPDDVDNYCEDWFITSNTEESLDYSLYESLFSYIKEAYAYYGKEYPFGDDFFSYAQLVYDLETQRYLGLR